MYRTRSAQWKYTQASTSTQSENSSQELWDLRRAEKKLDSFFNNHAVTCLYIYKKQPWRTHPVFCDFMYTDNAVNPPAGWRRCRMDGLAVKVVLKMIRRMKVCRCCPWRGKTTFVLRHSALTAVPPFSHSSIYLKLSVSDVWTAVRSNFRNCSP